MGGGEQPRPAGQVEEELPRRGGGVLQPRRQGVHQEQRDQEADSPPAVQYSAVQYNSAVQYSTGGRQSTCREVSDLLGVRSMCAMVTCMPDISWTPL